MWLTLNKEKDKKYSFHRALTNNVLVDILVPDKDCFNSGSMPFVRVMFTSVAILVDVWVAGVTVADAAVDAAVAFVSFVLLFTVMGVIVSVTVVAADNVVILVNVFVGSVNIGVVCSVVAFDVSVDIFVYLALIHT